MRLGEVTTRGTIESLIAWTAIISLGVVFVSLVTALWILIEAVLESHFI